MRADNICKMKKENFGKVGKLGKVINSFLFCLASDSRASGAPARHGNNGLSTSYLPI